MTSMLFSSSDLGPPIRLIVTVPGYLSLVCQTISYLEPAGIVSPLPGFTMGSKPSVWARAAPTKARTEAAKVKRILTV